jgi:hypothetical protein
MVPKKAQELVWGTVANGNGANQGNIGSVVEGFQQLHLHLRSAVLGISELAVW